MAQVQDHLEEVGRMERYMAQYGYKPLPPLSPSVLDWRTPPAAADLPPQTSEQGRDEGGMEAATAGTPANKENPPNNQKEDTPNIFDLGLSKQTLEIVVGKSVKNKSTVQVNEIKNAATDEMNDISQDVTIDMTVNASPILRLTSRLKACNTSLDASSSSTTANNTDTDTSQVEITPGLTTRRPGSSLRNRQSKPTTPCEPTLSLTSLDNTSKSQATTTPSEPSLTTQTKTCGAKREGTPSEPNLTVHAKKASVGTPATPTTTAKIEFSPDGTPVMPTLKTVNINAFNLVKTVSGEKREESPKPVGEDLVTAVDKSTKVLTGKSFLPKTPVQLLRKEASADTPETPDLMTRDIRSLISQAMGLKQGQGLMVDQTTPTDPELTVSRSIPESKEICSSSRATPEEPELKGSLLSTSRVVHQVKGLENTPELPELSIMADRTTAREDSLTPNTPVFSNHALGRLNK